VPYLLLLTAIVTEVAGTLAMRASNGFTRLVPTMIVVIGYVVSFIAMARALRSLQVGPVYAIWSGVGTVGVFVGGVLLFGERLRLQAVLGAAVIVLGVVIMNFGQETHDGAQGGGPAAAVVAETVSAEEVVVPVGPGVKAGEEVLTVGKQRRPLICPG
jgi:small multidrug resistance pump